MHLACNILKLSSTCCFYDASIAKAGRLIIAMTCVVRTWYCIAAELVIELLSDCRKKMLECWKSEGSLMSVSPSDVHMRISGLRILALQCPNLEPPKLSSLRIYCLQPDPASNVQRSQAFVCWLQVRLKGRAGETCRVR